jgi:hypothetical protein
LAKLRSGKLDCVRRSTTNPSQYDPVQASFWQDRQFDADYLHHFGELDIYATDVVTGRRDPGTRIDGREFYVYRPEEVWRALPQATKQNEPKPVGDKTGPKPKHDWKLFVAAEAWEKRKAGQRPPAAYFAQLCENKFNWQPDISDINELLRVLSY